MSMLLPPSTEAGATGGTTPNRVCSVFVKLTVVSVLVIIVGATECSSGRGIRIGTTGGTTTSTAGATSATGGSAGITVGTTSTTGGTTGTIGNTGGGGTTSSGGITSYAGMTGTTVQGAFLRTGNVTVARFAHTATLLPNGKVLIAGGVGVSRSLASAELYDPALGTFTATGSMTVARAFHTATLLLSGKVLIAGGDSSSGDGGGNGGAPIAIAGAEIYDPAAGTFAATGNMTVARFGHTATLLLSGKVLIAGGSGSYAMPLYSDSAEIFDAAVGIFTATGRMSPAQDADSATLLSNGMVLISGSGVAQLYDSAAGAFTATANMVVLNFNEYTATLLSSGMVLIAGGSGGIGDLASAELYDPTAEIFTATGSMTQARDSHTATLLPSGRVLIAGGENNVVALASAKLYDASTGTFTATSSMTVARVFTTATLLPNGKVLIVGGTSDGTTALGSAELYEE